MTMPKFHIIRGFGTASISLVGFAHMATKNTAKLKLIEFYHFAEYLR